MSASTASAAAKYEHTSTDLAHDKSWTALTQSSLSAEYRYPMRSRDCWDLKLRMYGWAKRWCHLGQQIEDELILLTQIKQLNYRKTGCNKIIRRIKIAPMFQLWRCVTLFLNRLFFIQSPVFAWEHVNLAVIFEFRAPQRDFLYPQRAFLSNIDQD
jgi:hypothetical protein